MDSVEKNSYNNLNDLDLKSFKDSAEPGVGTAASSSGMGTAAPGSDARTARAEEVRDELVRRLRKMSIWEAQEEAKRMSRGEKAALSVAFIVSDEEEGASIGERIDLYEKLCLLSPQETVHILIGLLVYPVAKQMPAEIDSTMQMINILKGTLGETIRAAQEDYDRAVDELNSKSITMEQMLQREKAADRELARCLSYAQELRSIVKGSLDREDWRKREGEERQRFCKEATELCHAYYTIVEDMITDICKALRDTIEKTEANVRTLASRPKPEDPRLTELLGMSPDEVRGKMIGDERYRSRSGELLGLAKEKLDKDDMDMFEKLLFLGAQGSDLEDALGKVKGSLRRSTHGGWLGKRIKELQEEMNKAPTVSSGWGLLWGLVVILLFIGLAALLFLHPAVPPFIADATGLILAIGMIVCFVVGLAGGLIGGVLAALAWAGVTYVLNLLVPLDKMMHIIVCILALAPSLLGLGWMMSSTPSAREKDRQARKKHIADCRESGKEIIEYISDLLVCIAPKETTADGKSAKSYYEAAAEKIRRMSPT